MALGMGAVRRHACGPAARAGPPLPVDEGAGRRYFPIGIETEPRTA